MKEKQPSSANNNHHSPSPSPSPSSSTNDEAEPTDQDQIMSTQMKELIYYAAMVRPTTLGLETTVEKKKRRNIKTSKDPQTVAARNRREKISENIRVLQTLVPGGSKMDIPSLLDEVASYLKFLKKQVKALECMRYKNGSNDFPPTPYFPH